jgi:glycosyltransferase involved in cell wall biosynthesis
VLTRAFACATPAVASDIDGYRDVMTPETAIAVPPGDDDALVGGLIALLDDEPRRAQMGREARRIAEENYRWDDIAARLLEIYEAAVGDRRAPAVAAR